MTLFDDETLMAFADGELDADRAAAVEAAVAADSALRERLAQIRDTDNLLRAAVAPGLDVPDRFAALLTPPANVVAFQPKARLQAQKWWAPAGGAIAAALALWMAGGSLLTGDHGWLRHVDDGVALSGAVEQAVLSTPSGSLKQVGDLNIRPVVSFVANDGRTCREVHVRDKEMAARVIACRDIAEDEWCIEALASIPVREFPDTYQTAGVTRNQVIDAAIARLGIKATLDKDGERDAIARKWSAK